ncbi:MAG: MmgE/PrpD family protein [Candidatus Dormiibacterota bacterium]
MHVLKDPETALVEGLTAEVAEFIGHAELASISPSTLDKAKRSLLDGFGLAVAGSRSAAAGIARREVASYGCANRDASVLGTAVKVPARFAGFLNGLAIHAEDYDDTQLATLPDRVYGLLTHPTAPVLPAALAIAEECDRSGADLLLGYLIGVEVATKVAEAIYPRHYDAGFHSTGTLGTIGAAAAAARMLHLDAKTTAVALGIAASQAAGLRENFGTMTKPFHAGRAAESGILGAQLARDGFTAATDILEARRGFFQAAGGGYDADAIHSRLGRPWTFADPGVSIKPYPSGSLTHPGMSAFIDLIRRENLEPADVDRVTVGTNRHMPNALIHHRPTNHLEAKFSMEFCIAILLLERRAGLEQFTDDVVIQPRVQEMIGRVHFDVDPEAESAGYNNMTTIIRIWLRDGRTFETRAAFGKGSPDNPMTDAELIEKFSDCLAWGGGPLQSAGRLAERLLNIDREPSVRQLLQTLTSPE